MGCFHYTVNDNGCEDPFFGLPFYFLSFYIFPFTFSNRQVFVGRDRPCCIQHDEICHESPKVATPKGQPVLWQRLSSIRYSSSKKAVSGMSILLAETCSSSSFIFMFLLFFFLLLLGWVYFHLIVCFVCHYVIQCLIKPIKNASTEVEKN